MDKKPVCVPLDQREPTKVDELQAQIKAIRDNCEHDFRLIKEPELQETNVPNVFAGGWELTLVCTKCSKKNITSTSGICPKCLSKMGESIPLGAGSYERYWGHEDGYYSLARRRCTNPDCEYASVTPYFDQ